jgi:hypothetical protein
MWDARGNKRYFYRHVRIAGRPVRRYVGAGPAAELAAAVDELRRLERAIEARERQAEEARLREAEAPLLALCEGVELPVRRQRDRVNVTFVTLKFDRASDLLGRARRNSHHRSQNSHHEGQSQATPLHWHATSFRTTAQLRVGPIRGPEC